MHQATNIGAFIVLARDKYPGHLKFSKAGEPFIDYRIHDYDLNHILHGMAKAGRIHFEAGAKTVHFLHQQTEAISDKNTELEQYLHKYSWVPNRFCLFSAHQMGTCRMSGSESHGPVLPDGMTREVENLYVADASLFPSASGVNPMITIGALAFHVADQITSRHA
jgi:choline dehydrogenase-like flavoprotein